MKVALVALLSAAFAAVSGINLRDGINPQNLPAIELPTEFLPEISLEYLLSVVLTNGTLEDGFIQADVTQYAEGLLNSIQTLIVDTGFDPMKLNEQKINLIPTGLITLENGFFKSLSNITLSDKVIARYSISTNIFDLTLPLEYTSLLITYDYYTQVYLFNFNGGVEARLSNFKMNFHMGFNFSCLHAFFNADITDSGSIGLNFTGQQPVNWIITPMNGVLTTFFSQIILDVMNVVIQSPINEAVDAINLCIDSILNLNITALPMY